MNSLHPALEREVARSYEILMTVTINGDAREIPDGSHVEALLAHLGLSPDRVAVERNRDILPREQWKETLIQAGDNFEIVHLVGGG